jgi:valacyclovir hydrolase
MSLPCPSSTDSGVPRIAIPDLSMHFEQAGQGSALLMIPGALGTGAGDFHAQIGWFAQHGFMVIAPDPRGYGHSRPPQRDFSRDFYHRDAADMFALMSGLGHQRFDIMGWSDGANIATVMAARQPERVRKLVVFGGQSFLTAQEIAALNDIRKISAWSPRAAGAMRQVYGAELDGLWDAYVDGQEALYERGGDLYKPLLSRIACPTLVLHGARDSLVPGLHPEAIHRGIAGSRLHIFPDGKHNIHQRYADQFNAIAYSFLTEPVQRK